MWQLMEPYHGLVYFSDEKKKEFFDAAGLKGGWMGYFASRSAAMGPVPAEVVIATFYNFHPKMVRRAIPDAWNFSSPERVLDARLKVADAVLRQALGDLVESDHVPAAAGLAWRAVEAASLEGRPLFAAHASLDRPSDPHLSLWLATTCLREFRGDGHVAALVAAGISGLEAHVLMDAEGTIPGELQRAFRGWSEEEWNAAADALRERGLLDSEAKLTVNGKQLRSDIEATTDRLALEAYRAIGRDGVDELASHMKVLTRAILESGVMAFPNPIGLLKIPD